MGYAYIELITSFFKRCFNWIYNLFDTKIVPKPPDHFWGPKQQTWHMDPMNDSYKKIVELSKHQEFFKSPFSPSSSSWARVPLMPTHSSRSSTHIAR